MPEPTREVYDLLDGHDHASSIPIDVAQASVLYQQSNPSTIYELQTISENELDSDSRLVVHRILDSGAVMQADNRKAAWAFPVGRTEDVIDEVVENTEYIITKNNE